MFLLYRLVFKISVILMIILTFVYLLAFALAAPTLRKKTKDEILNVFIKHDGINNETDPEKSRKRAIELISENPELGRELDQIKHAEIKQLVQLLKNVNDTSLSESERDKILMKIALKEPYLTHGHSEKFNEDDISVLQQIIQDHFIETDETENKIYHIEQIRKRIRDWHDILNSKKTINEVIDEYHKRRDRFAKKPMHEPGSREELEEIWKESDNEDGDFNPSTFFKLHDLNSDKMLDPEEIEALLEKVVAANFQEGTGEFYHELTRARKHFLEKMDKNSDLMISQQELIDAYRIHGPEAIWGPEEDYEFDDDQVHDKEKMLKYLNEYKPGEEDFEALEEWNIAKSELDELS